MVKYRYEFAMNLKRKFLLLILMMRCNIAQHIGCMKIAQQQNGYA